MGRMNEELKNDDINSEYLQDQSDRFRDGFQAAVRKLQRDGSISGMVAANELLLLLPPPFVSAYERLFWTALSTGSESGARDREPLGKAKGNSGTVLGSENRLQAAGTGKRFKNTGFMVRNEAALARKAWVDQKLQALVQDMEASLRGESLKARQCPGNGCKRLLDRKFSFCPWCGSKVG